KLDSHFPLSIVTDKTLDIILDKNCVFSIGVASSQLQNQEFHSISSTSTPAEIITVIEHLKDLVESGQSMMHPLDFRIQAVQEAIVACYQSERQSARVLDTFYDQYDDEERKEIIQSLCVSQNLTDCLTIQLKTLLSLRGFALSFLCSKS